MKQTNWQLTDLYIGIDDSKIDKDFSTCDKLIKKIQTNRGKLAKLKPSEVLELIQTWEDTGFILHKIGLFSSMMDATNVGVSEVTRFSKKMEARLVEKSKELIFIYVEFSKLNDKQWQKLLKAKELAQYRKTIHNLYLDTKHTLSEPEEKILAEKSQTSWQTLGHLFDITTNTLTAEWDGKKITLEELLTFIRDPDAKLRKKAAFALHEALKTNDKTTPALLNAFVQDKSITDRLRDYEFPEEARYMHEDVDKETVDALLKAVEKSFPMVERYYNLKKKILGTKELYWWDRYAPLPKAKTKVDAEEAQQMVLDSFYEFSPVAGDIITTMFKKQHIDWLPSPTKRGGAFCAYGGRGIYPFVLLNYTETLRDVMTVAHELGHAMHDVLADEQNVYFQTHPSLALAEIASVFSESLLFDKLMSDPKISDQDRISLLMTTIEDAFATVFRQVTMFQFEQQLHRKRKEEGELSKEQIDDLWHKTMKKPFGDSLIYTDEHKNTWMYVHHVFEMPFYVFSYAFAQLCVLALYKQYKKEGQEFVPRYLEILKAGGSLSPKDNLARAGLDITNPKFWKTGLQVIEDYINELEKLVNKK